MKSGMFFRELRDNRNLSQAQAAKLMKISRTTWTKWETGISTPNPLARSQLVRVFGVAEKTIPRKPRRIRRTTIAEGNRESIH